MAEDVNRRPGGERRVTERRQRERRQLRLDAIQSSQADLRQAVERTAAQIQRLEAEQRVQMVRIAQIQKELDDLKKNDR